MRMWLRQATLTLGSNQYTLDGLNFSFKVQFEDRAKVSTAAGGLQPVPVYKGVAEKGRRRHYHRGL